MSMDDFGMPAVEPQVVEKRRGWWSRNWLWFVPTVFLLLIIFCCGCPVGFFFYKYSELLDKPYVLDALREVQKNEQVREEIGSPVIISLMPPPTIVEDDRNADLRGELQGPEGKAKVHVQARKINDTWGLVVLEVILPSGEKLSLAEGIEGLEDALPFDGTKPEGETPKSDGPPPMIDMPTFDAPPNVE